MELREIIKKVLGLKKDPEGEGLAGFSDEQLVNAFGKLRDAFTEARTNEDTEAMTSALEALNGIKAAQDTRATEAADRSKTVSELDDQFSKITATDEPVKEEEEEEKPAEPANEPAPKPVEPETTPAPVVVAPVTTPVATSPEIVQVAASVDPEVIAAAVKAAIESTRPAPEPTKPAVPAPSRLPDNTDRPLVQLTAAADASQSYSAGMPIPFEEVGPAFKDKAEHFHGEKGDRAFIARATITYPEDLMLRAGTDADQNMARINEMLASVQSETAGVLKRIRDSRDPDEITELAAAGGICAPPTPRYEICQQGSDVRPLRDSLLRFGATRGGILTMSPPKLADVDGAVSVYTAAQDETGYDYPKDCIRVECGTPRTTSVKAIPLCMEVGNFMNLYYPEMFRAWWGYGQIAHARTAETELWDGMVALSTARTAIDHGFGASRNTLNELDRYGTQLRYEYRINEETPLRLWAPFWSKALLRADLTNQHPGDGTMSVSDAQLVRWLADRNMAVTFVLDAQAPGDGDDPLPGSFVGILALEGTFLHLDGGSLDFGTEIRDFDQIRNNDAGAFMETFENVEAICNGPQAITFKTCPTGASSEAIASAIECGS